MQYRTPRTSLLNTLRIQAPIQAGTSQQVQLFTLGGCGMETAGSGKVLRGALKRNAITGYMREVAPVVDHPFIYLELWIPFIVLCRDKRI